MGFRIGYGGPKKYRHGRHYPGGRANNGGMTEIERLIHLIASMQILFGSRRGSWVVPLVIVGLAAGGWFLYRYNSSDHALEQAHANYVSSDTELQMAAVVEYKKLLNKSDPFEPGRFYLMKERDLLYRRIIRHEILFAENDAEAFDWATKAWDEGITDITFQDDRVSMFWNATIAKLKNGNRSHSKKEKKPEDEKFGDIPGIDN